MENVTKEELYEGTTKIGDNFHKLDRLFNFWGKKPKRKCKALFKEEANAPPPTPTIFQVAIALNPPMRLAPTMTIPPVATTSWPATTTPAYWAYPPIYVPFRVHATPMFTKVKHLYLIFDNGID